MRALVKVIWERVVFLIALLLFIFPGFVSAAEDFNASHLQNKIKESPTWDIWNLLGNFASLLQIASFLGMIYVGMGIRRILNDIGDVKNNKVIKGKARDILQELEAKKPLKSDLNIRVKHLLLMIKDEYIKIFHFKRRKKFNNVLGMIPITDENRSSVASSLRLLLNSITSIRDLHDDK